VGIEGEEGGVSRTGGKRRGKAKPNGFWDYTELRRSQRFLREG